MLILLLEYMYIKEDQHTLTKTYHSTNQPLMPLRCGFVLTVCGIVCQNECAYAKIKKYLALFSDLMTQRLV